MENFGERLRILREKKNLTTTQLGEVLGLSNQQISKYENNLSDMRMSHIEKLCKLFGVSADYLMTGIKKENELEMLKREIALQKELLKSKEETINALKEVNQSKNIEVVSESK